MNNLISFCINPLANLIENEINAKFYSETDFLNGNYIKINTKKIKSVDIHKIAISLDKLLASGTFSINECREFIDLENINEKWAEKHFITKNYQDVENINKTVKEVDKTD